MKLKILHIQGSALIGGIGKLVRDFSLEQKRDSSLEVGLFFMQTHQGGFYEAFRNTGLDLFSADLVSGYDLHPKKYIYAYRLFRKYDILHFHSFNPFIVLAAILSGSILIFTDHGNYGQGRRRRLSDRINTRLSNIFLNRFVRFITFNSQFTRSMAVERYGLRRVPHEVVYNGIRFDDCSGAGEELEPYIAMQLQGRFVVGTSSRFAGFKRIDRLIEAFAEFQRNKQDAVLLLVGDGPLRGELEGLARDRGIGQKVLFAGFRTNVRVYQRAMDVCVFPSQDEPFGLVAVETLSLGKPVIVFSDGGGIVDLIGACSSEDVVAGVPDLVRRLEYYFVHRHEPETVRTRRIAFAKKFNVGDMAQHFKEIYMKCTSCAE
jgi:glycosyltransferase involved in cell wall biosynthesis